MTIDNRPFLTYRVRIGHHDLRVKARDVAEAVEIARRQLGRELPRLYDLIRNLTAAKFQVEAPA
jgi:hypothetical protein